MTTSVPQVKADAPFVFMSAKTLKHLRRVCDKNEVWSIARTWLQRGPRHSRYARYRGKRVITCELLPPGVITESITQEQAEWILRRFTSNGWPTPREVTDIAIGRPGK